MTQIIKNLNKYGRAVSFHSQNGEKICDLHAMISPLRYKNKMYLYGVNTEIGYNSQGHYLYIGPPTPDLTQISERDYLFSGEEKFMIDRAEKVVLSGKPIYIWAIIRTMTEITEV